MRALLLLVGLAAAASAAQLNRFYLFAQYSWDLRQGFYLDVENEAPDGQVCQLAGARLHLGLGDGRDFRFVSPATALAYDQSYHLRAVLDAQQGQLWLDGVLVGTTEGGFVPAEGALVVAEHPDWAADETDYQLRLTRFSMTVGDQTLAREMPAPSLHPAVEMFARSLPLRLPWTAAPGALVELDATMVVRPRPQPRDLAPLIDRFGQNRYAEFPGKVTSVRQMRADAAAEARRLPAPPAGVDRFGGLLGAPWHEEPTGFYRALRRDGRWWLVSPEGHPLFYVGLSGVPMLTWETTPVTGREWLFADLPAKDGPLSVAWSSNQWGGTDGTEYFCHAAANMRRTYGARWTTEAERRARARVRAWGFSGAAKWGHLDGLAETPVLQRWAAPNLVRRPDIFDPAAQTVFRQVLADQVEPRRDDPYVLGWTVGSEFDEIVTSQEIQDILTLHPTSPSADALRAQATAALYGGDDAQRATAWAAGVPQSDVEPLRRFYADAYYSWCARTLRELDPNHLLLGNYIVPGWWENEEDWRLIAKHCDVISYDRYALEFTTAQLDELIAETDKPILCGEFAFPPFYDGARGFGRYGVWADSDAHAGELYAQNLVTALANPWCVVVCWFMYRDQPLTGRGPGQGEQLVYNEHYAFGLVDVADRPKWDLVHRVRAANVSATARRLAR